jgi:phage-related protein
MALTRPLAFLGSSLDDLREFPLAARRDAGFQLDRVQRGEEPNDWKPMRSVGAGVREIRVRDELGAFRVLYVAKYQGAIYVLHCFEKKSQTTRRHDIELAAARYRQLVKEVGR